MSVFLKILIVILLIGLVSALVASFFYLASTQLTEKEGVMLGILQTIFSLLASWIISELYGRYQYQKDISEIKKDYQSNLKIYARKASEKVDNLSNELSKLALYLQQELDNDNDNIEEDNLSKKERIVSAIHIINTLKSINDKSLSDWQGVIPEELDERRQDRKETVKGVNELIEKVELLIEKNEEKDEPSDEDASNNTIDQLNEIKKIVNYLSVTQLGVSPSMPDRKKKAQKEIIVRECPICGVEQKYKQRADPKSNKTFTCKKCSNRLVAKWTIEDGFILRKDELVEEIVKCKLCTSQFTTALKLSFGSTSHAKCPKCQQEYRIIRDANSVRIKAIDTTPIDKEVMPIDEELISKVASSLPPQPWPTGTSQALALELNISKGTMHRIIEILIDRGLFKVQRNGVLYEKEVVPITSVDNANNIAV